MKLTTRRASALRLLASLAVVSALGGCANVKQQEGQTAVAVERAQRLLAEAGRPMVAPHALPKVIHDEGVWLGSRTVPLEARSNLPPGFFEQVTFDRSLGSLQEFADRISMRSGMAVAVTDDGKKAAAAALPDARGGQSAARSVPISSGPLPPGLAAPVDIGPSVRISFSGGNLKQLMDVVAARFGVSWRYDGARAVFYHLDTRHFRIHALSGEASMQTSVSSSGATGRSSSGGGGGGGGGSGGGGAESGGSSGAATSQAGFAVQHALWANMQKAMQTLLTVDGKLVLAPETGTVSVTDTPDVVEKVGKYIEQQNKILTSQVILNVTVLAVTLNNTDAYGIDWNLVYRKASQQFGIRTNLGLAGEQSGNALSANVLGTSSSRILGSNVMIQALSEQGKVRRETAAALTALNHQPVPLVVGRNRAYISGVTRDITAGGLNPVITTTLTASNFNVGFSMTLLPYIMENGKLILQFSTELSSLVNLRSFAAAGAELVQLPELDTRQFMQRVTMHTGETLVISGFEQTDSNVRRSGIGAPENMALGGEMNGNANREIIVIMVTPVIFGQ